MNTIIIARAPRGLEAALLLKLLAGQSLVPRGHPTTPARALGASRTAELRGPAAWHSSIVVGLKPSSPGWLKSGPGPRAGHRAGQGP